MLDALVRLLFEDLPLLLLAQAAALAVVLAVHRRCMTTRSRRMVWIALAVCAAQIAVQHLVVTSREELKALVRTLAEAVEDGDVPAIGRHLADRIDVAYDEAGRVPRDEGFRGGDDRRTRDLDKDEFLAATREQLQRYDVNEVRLSQFRVRLAGEAGTVAFQAMCDVRGDHSAPLYQTPSEWELGCTRTPAGWKIERIRYRMGLNLFGR